MFKNILNIHDEHFLSNSARHIGHCLISAYKQMVDFWQISVFNYRGIGLHAVCQTFSQQFWMTGMHYTLTIKIKCVIILQKFCISLQLHEWNETKNKWFMQNIPHRATESNRLGCVEKITLCNDNIYTSMQGFLAVFKILSAAFK